MTKTKLSKEEILHLSKLANLNLSNEEIKKIQRQLTETLDYIKNLKELKTDKVDPTHHTVNSINVFFEDGQNNSRGLSNISTYFKVKRIL